MRPHFHRVHLIYAICVSLSIVVAGVCLMAACLGIYLSGDDPFTRQSVAAAFAPISVPVYLCLCLVVLGFVLELIAPKEQRPAVVGKQRRAILSRLRSQADASQAPRELQQQIFRARQLYRLGHILSWVLMGLGALIFAAYLLSADRFSVEDINASVLRCTVAAAVCFAVPLGWIMANAYWRIRVMDREIACLKQLPKAVPASQPAKKASSVWIAQLLIVAVAVALIFYGAFTGGAADVLVKAINICTECVGLG